MNKMVNFLGLAYRAGQIIGGFDAVVTSVNNKTAKLVMLASDASPKTKKEIVYYCGDKVEIITADITIDDTSKMLRKKYAVMAVLDENFAKRFLAYSAEQ